jgi:hypothetical protein
MQAVIVKAKLQIAEVDRLVQYCKQLDGTVVKVIQNDEKVTSYPERNNHALQQAFNVIGDEPFIWLEPDSIPLKDGWVTALEKEYKRLGKHIMLSSDTNPPHDIVGGIGVYGGLARKLIPAGIKSDGWDGWTIKHIKPLVSFTPLIQHTYGNYSKKGCSQHVFPRDNHIIRDDAVIFHRDKQQGLISK